MTTFPMTPEGESALREELDQLKKVARPEIIRMVAEARDHGDLKENAEYHAAREQQGIVEARIQELSHKLSHVQVIDIRKIKPTGSILFGTTVHLLDIEADQKNSYRIVGEDEADIQQRKISVVSPIAKALIGRRVGELVDIRVPSGVIQYEVLAVEHC